ncbi:sulfite exporter TauE/SafE family protein [Gynuella sunshinyii]|uniref:Probable membrane transporter protein n=1 Tax=Gynuella sunshinyii YC6258 TaxID=1445510 RepID=A0A0C5VQH5_9GAMM|nr:sulfite exporter TauE/SafE family protein [Gynuella sunshinyii]AJQ96827.1 putative permease [Gynuella sunshinyii YC6258]
MTTPIETPAGSYLYKSRDIARQILSHPIIWLYGILFPYFHFTIFTWETGFRTLISEYGIFLLLGLIGALVANSTGAGGGVVFIPFFAAMGIMPVQAIATSMAIQSCGMTAGALSWLHALHRQYRHDDNMLITLKQLILVSGLATVCGMLIGQYLITQPVFEMALVFRLFSITFGIVLIVFTLLTRKRSASQQTPLKDNVHQRLTQVSQSLTVTETVLLVLTSLAGGMVTAWISVGVGEFVALLLFFLRFPTSVAVAIGVFTSSIAVLTGVIQHLSPHLNISLEIVLFAGQSALIGGFLARYITQYLGGNRLKLFFSAWIILTGILME